MRSAVAVLAATISFSPAGGHSWNYGQHYRNPAGELCCGVGDCFLMHQDIVRMDGAGYWLFNLEHIPFIEAIPSPDGQFWRCRKSDGTRRCFFAPMPSM